MSNNGYLKPKCFFNPIGNESEGKANLDVDLWTNIFGRQVADAVELPRRKASEPCYLEIEIANYQTPTSQIIGTLIYYHSSKEA